MQTPCAKKPKTLEKDGGIKYNGINMRTGNIFLTQRASKRGTDGGIVSWPA